MDQITETTQDSEDPKFPVRIRRYTERLPCKLSSEEIVTRAKRMAQLGREISKQEDALKSHSDLAKAEIKKLEALKAELETEIDVGETMREVGCQERALFRLGEVQYVRTDTGEVMKVRPFNDEERQPELPGVNASNGAHADDAEDSADDSDEDEPDEEGSGGDEEPPPELLTQRGRGRRKSKS